LTAISSVKFLLNSDPLLTDHLLD